MMNKEPENRKKFLLPVVKKHLGVPLLLAGKEKKTIDDCLNIMMAELVKNASPEELQFSIYDGTGSIAHSPSVSRYYRILNTSASEAIRELEWANEEMSRRYDMLSAANCRNLDGYNKKHKDATWPHLVIVIGELADLMEVEATKTEALLVQLCARSRRVGMYVLCSASRIRTDVLTSRILNSFGRRLVFKTDSKEESKLLGMGGLENLPQYLRPYRGNPASFLGHHIAEAEKHWLATRLEADEAVFFFFEGYFIGYENGRQKIKKRQRRWLVEINDKNHDGL